MGIGTSFTTLQFGEDIDFSQSGTYDLFFAGNEINAFGYLLHGINITGTKTIPAEFTIGYNDPDYDNIFTNCEVTSNVETGKILTVFPSSSDISSSHMPEASFVKVKINTPSDATQDLVRLNMLTLNYSLINA